MELLTLAVAALMAIVVAAVLSRRTGIATPLVLLVLGTVLVMTGVALRLRELEVVGVLALIVLLQMATSVVSSHMVGRASFRAGQVRADLLVVDELSDGPGHEEPRGAP